MTRCIPVVAPIAGAALMASTAFAQSNAVWTADQSGLWTNPARWTINPPGPAFPNNNGVTFDVSITVPGPSAYTVTLDQNITIDSLNLNSANATLDLNGPWTLNVLNGWTSDGTALIDGLGNGGSIVVGGSATFGDTRLRGLSLFDARGPVVYNTNITCEIDDTGVNHGDGTALMVGPGDIVLSNGASITNAATCVFSISGSGRITSGVGATPSLANNGTIIRDTDAGPAEVLGVTFQNAGTLEVRTGSFRTDGLDVNGNGNRLTGGTYRLNGGGIDLIGQQVLINEANVEFLGAGAFAAFENQVQTNAPAGRITVGGARTLTSANQFRNDGRLTIEAGATVDVPVDLQNVAAGTFSSGEFTVRGTLRAPNLTGINALDAKVTLDGPAADIPDAAFPGLNAMRTIATISTGGELGVVGGKTLTTTTDLTLNGAGRLTVGAGSTVTVGGTITNLAGGVFSNGALNVAGTLRFDDADIGTVDGDLALTDAAAQIVDQNNFDAFRNLATVTAAGALTVSNGRNLATTGSLSQSGAVNVGAPGAATDTTLTLAGAYNQSAGATTLNRGIINAPGGFNLDGGELRGSGSINGNVVTGGTIKPGNSPGLLFVQGDVSITADAGFVFEFAGRSRGVPGGFDAIDIAGVFAHELGRAGVLSLELIEGFTPQFGDVFRIVNAGSITGVFDRVNAPGLPGGLRFEVEYHADAIDVVVVPAPAGLVVSAVGLLAMRRRRR